VSGGAPQPTGDRRLTWTVTVGVEDHDGTWWDRTYDVAAPTAATALAAGRLKAREANPYAQAISAYSAKVRSPRGRATGSSR
jgi:hypothetical protein